MQGTVSLFKALSEEIRLRILALLADGELCVCDVMSVLGLPQSTSSRHLTTLRHAGLVAARRQGTWMYYRLEEGSMIKKILPGLQQHLADLPVIRDDRQALAAHLKEKEKDHYRCA